MPLVVFLRRLVRRAWWLSSSTSSSLQSPSTQGKDRPRQRLFSYALFFCAVSLALLFIAYRQFSAFSSVDPIQSVVRQVSDFSHALSSSALSESASSSSSSVSSSSSASSSRLSTSYSSSLASEKTHQRANDDGYEPLRSRVDAIVGEGHSAKRILVDMYALPSIIVSNMTHQVAARLYWKLVYTDVVRALRHHTLATSQKISYEPSLQPHATVFFVHAQNGLGNRLRAMAAGIALARSTHRVPVVVWQRDAHLGTPLQDIISVNSFGSDINTVLYRDLIIMEDFPSWNEIPMQDTYWQAYNYMQKDGRGAVTDKLMRFELLTDDSFALMEPPSSISAPSDAIHAVLHAPPRPAPPAFDAGLIRHYQHVYFKSGYVANIWPHRLKRLASINDELRSLRPTAAVSSIVARVNEDRLRRSYGVHIRSRSLARDNVAVDNDCEYSTLGAWTTDYWRSQSQLPVFVAKMRQKIRIRKDATFFVAADDNKLIEQLEQIFPGRIDSIHRSCDDRASECVVYAMADLLCLAKTRRLYGSNWSSFSEVAGRLTNRRLYLSGKHFGRPKEIPPTWSQIAKSLPFTIWKWWASVRSPYFSCRAKR